MFIYLHTLKYVTHTNIMYVCVYIKTFKSHKSDWLNHKYAEGNIKSMQTGNNINIIITTSLYCNKHKSRKLLYNISDNTVHITNNFQL